MKKILALGFPAATCAFAIACTSTSPTIPWDTNVGTDSTGTDDAVVDSGKKATKDSSTKEDFELVGTWTTSYGGAPGGTATITNETWTEYATLTIVSFDNKKNIAILQNPPADSGPLDPNKFSRNVWIEPKDGVSYYCTDVYGFDTEAEALAAESTADETDLDGKGCGGSAWTKLKKAE